MNLVFRCALLAILVLGAGCRSKDPPKEAQPTPIASASVANVPPKLTAPLPPREPPNAPTEEDFEDEVESITAKNLEDELDKLEKELSAR